MAVSPLISRMEDQCSKIDSVDHVTTKMSFAPSPYEYALWLQIIKRMRKQWKPGPFLLPLLGLGTRLLSSLPSRRELVIASPRTAAVKRCAREVTDAIAREQNKQTLSQELLSSLRSPLELKQGATMPQRREMMWVHYIELQGTTL